MTDERAPHQSPSGILLDELTPPTLQAIIGAPVVVLAAANAEVFGAAGLAFVTRQVNQRILVEFSGSRDNTDAAGIGSYSLEIDGVLANGITRQSEGATIQTVSFSQVVIVPLPGTHEANVRLAAAVGDETLQASANLLVYGSSSGSTSP